MRSHIKTIAAAWVCTLFITAVAHGAAQVTFDHSADTPRLYTRSLKGGDTLTVVVENTCPDRFTYEHKGVLREEARQDSQKTQTQGAGDVDLAKIRGAFDVDCVIELGSDRNKKELEIQHEKKFGGYLVEIRRTGSAKALVVSKSTLDTLAKDSQHCPNANPVPCRTALQKKASSTTKELLRNPGDSKKELPSATLTIQIDPIGWETELAGGFTFSELVGERFALVSHGSGDEEVQVVIRENDLEDEAALGLAGMIHMTHTKHPSIALSLGIGVSEDSRASYFVGPSWRLGGKGFLTVGYNWGPIDSRPSGVKLSPDPRNMGVAPESLFPVNDANVLNNLGSRTKGAFFMSLSYAFLNPGEAFFKKGFGTADDTKKKDGAGGS